MRVDCECNRPPFLATVFNGASEFNGDLNKWNVAQVTDMYGSKSIRIVANDLCDDHECLYAVVFVRFVSVGRDRDGGG